MGSVTLRTQLPFEKGSHCLLPALQIMVRHSNFSHFKFLLNLPQPTCFEIFYCYHKVCHCYFSVCCSLVRDSFQVVTALIYVFHVGLLTCLEYCYCTGQIQTPIALNLLSSAEDQCYQPDFVCHGLGKVNFRSGNQPYHLCLSTHQCNLEWHLFNHLLVQGVHSNWSGIHQSLHMRETIQLGRLAAYPWPRKRRERHLF